MNWVQVISSYICLNLLLVVGYLGLNLFSRSKEFFKIQFHYSIELKLNYLFVLLILFLAGAQPWMPKSEFLSPPIKVWSAPSIEKFVQNDPSKSNSGYISLDVQLNHKALKAEPVSHIIVLFFLALISFSIYRLINDFIWLIKIQKKSFLIRKLGRVLLLANDQIKIPFSFWLPFRAFVVVPLALVNQNSDYRTSVLHELQHHRQRDTLWIYLFGFLKVICIFNPAVHFWNRKVSEIQEFACDETLVDQGKVDSQSYARCLVEVAQTALGQKNNPASATGIIYLIESSLLKRRIEKMLNQKKKSGNSQISILIGVILTFTMGITSYASKSIIQDKRISQDQAQALAKNAQKQNSDFPIVVNDMVLQQLNRFLGTPEGRDYMRESLARMESHKSVIDQHLEKYKMPQELLALPIIESGYRNLSQGHFNSSNKSAGIWQFIPSTARVFGLKVEKETDERLDISRNTDAAMRYLKSNYLRFQDWQLSVMAYNMGENAVQNGIDKAKTRDPWLLIKKGHEGDKNYLAKFMAALIIMRNPEVVN